MSIKTARWLFVVLFVVIVGASYTDTAFGAAVRAWANFMMGRF